MSLPTRPSAGPAQPVSIVTSGATEGEVAIPVYGYSSQPTDRPVLGGPAQRAKILTSADLIQNGGKYRLAGNAYALPVFTAPAGTPVLGGTPITIYPINAWPEEEEVVVPFSPLTDIANAVVGFDFNSLMWQNAARTTPATANDDPVWTWDEQVGAKHGATYDNAARPLLKIAPYAGATKALLFTPADGELYSTPSVTHNIALGDFYCFIVARTGGAFTTSPALLWQGTYSFIADISTAGKLRWGNGQDTLVSVATLSVSTRYCFEVVRSGSTISLYINGVFDRTLDALAFNITNGVFGIGHIDGSAFWNGHYETLWIYKTAPTSEQMASMRAYYGVEFSPLTIISHGVVGFDRDSSFWQDTGRSVPAAADTDPVRVADDRIGSNHFVTASDAERPVLKLTPYAGATKAMLSDGSNDRIETPSIAHSIGTGNFYWVVVLRTPATLGVLKAVARLGDAYFYINFADKVRLDWDASYLSTASLSPSTRYMIEFRRESGSTKIFINGAEDSTHVTAASLADGSAYMFSDASGTFGNMHIEAMWLYKIAPTPTQQAAMRTYYGF